ncbi:MAG TPA: response regulator, partial [Jatrophihabitantaceae bacterium]|nr:response regulator [Jatrophihabitantaceae bacterium]
MISVGIVDDAAEVRILVRAQLSHAGRFTVVGEGSDGRDAIELARTLRPSVLLLDVSMPRMDGLEALPHIREVSPNTRVIMYTGFDEGGLAARAHDLGAAGLIEKSMALDDLVEQLDVILGPDDPDEELVASVDLDETPAPDPDTAQQVLGEHVERFREVFEEAAIGMATMTLTGVIVRANKALAALVERDVRDLVGVPYSSVITETPDEVFATALEEAQASGGVVVRFEHRVDVADRPRWLLSTIAPVRDARGRALYLFLQAQDITAQRSTEDALRESEERFRLLVEAVQDYAIFML